MGQHRAQPTSGSLRRFRAFFSGQADFEFIRQAQPALLDMVYFAFAEDGNDT